jgi:hypothetical protein
MQLNKLTKAASEEAINETNEAKRDEYMELNKEVIAEGMKKKR